METTEMILTYVTAFLGSGAGATILACLIKGIANCVAKVKIAKASKLTEKDKIEMTAAFEKSLENGVTINMDAQLDKATNKRFNGIEKLLNDVAKQSEENAKTLKLVAEAMSQFKTLTADVKNRLAENSNGNVEISKIDVVGNGTIKVEPKEESKEEKASY